MARLLIVGGGCRGLELARSSIEEGYAVRIVTREFSHRTAIEEVGAECWIGDPDRLATLRGALEGVAVAAWLLGTASGSSEQLQALHGPRLRGFLESAIDSTARGVIYEAAGTSVGLDVREQGVEIAKQITSRNSIPLVLIEEDPEARVQWLLAARSAVSSILG